MPSQAQLSLEQYGSPPTPHAASQATLLYIIIKIEGVAFSLAIRNHYNLNLAYIRSTINLQLFNYAFKTRPMVYYLYHKVNNISTR